MATDLALFDILLSSERSTKERLEALSSLRPFLESAEGIDKLSVATPGEESKEVKRAMLEMLCSIDIALIKNHPSYIDTLATVACLEPERDLRYTAVLRLATLAAHNNDVQEILALTLTYDLDTAVQLASIQGLRNAVYKTEATITALYAYLPLAPVACKAALLGLVQQLMHPHAAQMLLHFLDPLEQEALRLEAVNCLAAMPFLLPETSAVITAALAPETSLPVRFAIVKLLAGLQWIDAAIFKNMFVALQQMPDQPELLTLIADRLTANPGLNEDFLSLFNQTTSSALKTRLLSLLQHSEMPQLIINALQDPSPYVREAAIPLLTNKFAQWQALLEPVLAKVISEEPLRALRGALVDVMLNTGRKSAQTENLLIQLAVAETDHALKTQLAYAVCQVVATTENRHSLLQLFSEVLEGPWYPELLKQHVIARLQTFAYINDPALKKSLELMLDQAKDVYELERIYNVLKTLETDFSQLAPALLKALYRHIAWYPQQPLHDWVQMIGKLADQHAELRAGLPYLVSVTGANWLLKNADKSDQTGAFLPTFKNAMLNDASASSFMGMKSLITDAWNNRTIKKSELAELYKILLRMPKSVGLIQLVLGIMQQGKLVTPELVTVSLDYIMNAQDNGGIWEVRQYLEKTGFMDLEYRQRVTALFTQENFNRYMQYNVPDIHSKRRVNTLNDWEYGGWTCPYSQWPLAQLVFALEPGDLITHIFNQPLTAEDSSCTLQYLVLEHLFRGSSGNWAKSIFKDPARFEAFLFLLSDNLQQLPAGNALRDRMLYTFWKKWNDYVGLLNGKPIPTALTDTATLVYAGVCEVLKNFDPAFNGKQYPDVLKNMNKDLLQQHWPWTTELWEAFSYKYFPVKDPGQDAAVALFQRAAKALQSGNREEGHQLLKELLVNYPDTRLVKEKLSVINDTIKQLEESI
jgi:hypothetical protein